MLKQGDVLWICSGQWGSEHMHVVLSRPEDNPQRIVLAPWTTRDDGVDETCMIYVDDHEKVDHDTCVDYQRVTLATEAGLLEALKAGTIRRTAPVSKSLLTRILHGANERANFMANECEEVLLAQGLIE